MTKMEPEKQILTSVGVVEDFYGEPLSRELISLVRRTPQDQLQELANRLFELNYSAARLEDRLPGDSGAFRARRADRPIVVHDETYLRGGRAIPLEEISGLRHMLLYSDRMVLPDPIVDWAESELQMLEYAPFMLEPIGDSRPKLANGLASLMPFLPLVRSGAAILLPSPEHVRVEADPLERGWLSTPFESSRIGARDPVVANPNVEDPYLSWVFVNKLAAVPRWQFDAWGIDPASEFHEAASMIMERARYEPKIVGDLEDIVGVAHGAHASTTEVYDGVIMNRLSACSGLTPFTSSRVVQNHLARCSLIATEGCQAPAVDSFDAARSAIKFRFPAMSAVSLSDLVGLRLQEELFSDVRAAFTALAGSIADTTTPRSYTNFQEVAAAIADDIVGPVHARLDRERRRARLTSVVGSYLASGVVSLGINALATLLGGPVGLAARSAGGAAGNAARAAASGRLGRRNKERELACSLLLSVLPAERS
ncbi:hypothetical protein K1W54_12330 [Micromonospora sp. CPCC 205371]|nr:hypothetical protein [Micromonospora sp. CPCC 205371]